MRGLRHQHDFAVVAVPHHRLVGTRRLGEQHLLDDRLQRAVAQPLHECRVDADELGRARMKQRDPRIAAFLFMANRRTHSPRALLHAAHL